MEQKYETLATVKVERHEDTYKIVDLLNRTLKDQDLLFGLALDSKDKEQMVFSIYRT
ncbi:YpmA family protein [Exiguobacterium flavidum]|uniref:YpmA family protein n=1 Tax=Exiguobacterium flavidum TaxID=2184695 RepID=UPI000DF848AD|nr:YpmA family protein [Exiguobacterium flavidum]